MTPQLTQTLARLEELAKAATAGPWFLHDFADIAVSEFPSVNDVTVSCDHPATSTVCQMGNAMTATLEEARANAAFIAANSPAEILALIAQVRAEVAGQEWRSMASAPKDGTPVLLKVKNALPKKDDALAGVQFVGRNVLGKDSYDYGWSFAAPVGYGGIPDEWLDGWCHLKSPPAEEE